MGKQSSGMFMGVSAKWRVTDIASPDQPKRCSGRITMGGTTLSLSAFVRWCAYNAWSWNEVRALMDSIGVPLLDTTIDAQWGDGERVRRHGNAHHGDVPEVDKKGVAILENARKSLQIDGRKPPEHNRNKKHWLQAEDADEDENLSESGYVPDGVDRRTVAKRLIKLRRGQAQFRNSLRKRYGSRCLVTGCTVLDALEAAHIQPYRSENDHHAQNGLLLRADIHTLFDLDLLGIEPNTLKVELHPSVMAAYEELSGTKLDCSKQNRPSLVALKQRYNEFCERLSDS